MTMKTTVGHNRNVSERRALFDELNDVLRAAAALDPIAPRVHPLLDALIALDQQEGADRARRLMILGAAVHDDADERRVAEYLLRHRHDVFEGRTTRSLVAAARFAAEMDARRMYAREIPIDASALSVTDRAVEQLECPSVGEIVVEFLQASTCMRLTVSPADRIRDAVATAMELAERHVLNGGHGPSLLAMRPSARPASRLVTYLRDQLPAASARCVARVLVGADGTGLSTAALWWAAKPPTDANAVPALTRSRWTRDLQVLDAECAAQLPPAHDAAA